MVNLYVHFNFDVKLLLMSFLHVDESCTESLSNVQLHILYVFDLTALFQFAFLSFSS